MVLITGYDSFVNGEFVPKSVQTDVQKTWADLEPIVKDRTVLLVDFDQTLFQETWFDDIWNEEWENNSHFGSQQRLKHCESTLHAIMRQYMKGEMSFDLHENLLAFLQNCKKIYGDELVILIWTARDKTVHEDFVPKVLEEYDGLVDGYCLCRGRKVEAVEQICRLGPRSLCAFDDRITTLNKIDELQFEFPIKTVHMTSDQQTFDFGEIFGEHRTDISESPEIPRQKGLPYHLVAPLGLLALTTLSLTSMTF